MILNYFFFPTKNKKITLTFQIIILTFNSTSFLYQSRRQLIQGRQQQLPDPVKQITSFKNKKTYTLYRNSIQKQLGKNNIINFYNKKTIKYLQTNIYNKKTNIYNNTTKIFFLQTAPHQYPLLFKPREVRYPEKLKQKKL